MFRKSLTLFGLAAALTGLAVEETSAQVYRRAGVNRTTTSRRSIRRYTISRRQFRTPVTRRMQVRGPVTTLRRTVRQPVRRPTYQQYYLRHNLQTTRGINPNGAVVNQGGGTAGRYATNSRNVRQARQATQARQYVQPIYRRFPVRYGRR